MSTGAAEQRLILLSAGTAQRRTAARAQAATLAAQVDWSRLAATLYARRLLPLLGPRILELLGDTADTDFAAAVARAHEAARRQGQLLTLLTLRLLELLAAAGIRAAPLKGPLLGQALHGDPGRRLSSDVDLLVAPEQLAAAVAVARELGYGAPSDHLLADGLPLLHLRMLDARAKLPPLELHWRVHWYERHFARERLLPPAPAQGGWTAPSEGGSSTPLEGGSSAPLEGWRPAPADELAALLLFYARDGFIDLRIATDLSAWWDTRGRQLAPAGLAPLLDAYPRLARAIAAAAHVTENVVGVPAAALLGDAARAAKLDARQRLAVRLANPHPHASQAQLYADMGLVDGLLAPPGDLRQFVRRQLLPPAEVLDQQARHGQRHGARSAAARCLGVLGRYALTVARRGLTRTRAPSAAP
jgi:hypothetical protein